MQTVVQLQGSPVVTFQQVQFIKYNREWVQLHHADFRIFNSEPFQTQLQ